MLETQLLGLLKRSDGCDCSVQTVVFLEPLLCLRSTDFGESLDVDGGGKRIQLNSLKKSITDVVSDQLPILGRRLDFMDQASQQVARLDCISCFGCDSIEVFGETILVGEFKSLFDRQMVHVGHKET